MTKLVEKNDKVKSFSALLVENQLIPVPIRFLNQLRKAQVLQNSLKKVYLSILLSNWNCYLWESITAYNYGFAQDLPEKGKPCAKPLTVKRQFVPNRRRPIQFGIFYAEKQKMWYSPAEKLCAEKAQFIKNKFELRSIFFWILIE